MMENKARRREMFWHMGNIIVPLILGAMIYLRSAGGTYFHDLVQWLHIEWRGPMLRAEELWLRKWGCDFLWAYALHFAALMIWQTPLKTVLIAAACSIGLECLQLIQVDWLRCGYFDFWDIIVEVLAVCIGCAVAQLYKLIAIERRKKEHGKQHQ